MWILSLGLEDHLGEGNGNPRILAWRVPMDRGAWRAIGYRVGHDEVT